MPELQISLSDDAHFAANQIAAHKNVPLERLIEHLLLGAVADFRAGNTLSVRRPTARAFSPRGKMERHTHTPHKLGLTPGDKDRMRNLKKSGLTFRQIGTRFNTSEAVVRHALQGTPPKFKRRSGGQEKIPYEEIVNFAGDYRAAAQHFNVSVSTVNRARRFSRREGAA